jgi:hypothetical protein
MMKEPILGAVRLASLTAGIFGGSRSIIDAMHCANCGAPITPSRDAGQRLTCPYCGTAAEPAPPTNTVGALVDQILAQVEPAGQHFPAGGIKSEVAIHHATYSVNGQTYSSLDEMPPAARRALEDGMAMVQGTWPRASEPVMPAGPSPLPAKARLRWVLLAFAVGLLLLLLGAVLAFWMITRG